MTLLPLLFAATAVTQSAYPATDTFAAQADVIGELSALYPDVEVQVGWLPCKTVFGDYEENGFYEDGHIYLCTEMENHHDAAVGMAAHEFAHAVMMERFGYTTEQEADELMALWMVQLHHPSAAIANGRWLRGLDDGKHVDGDPHPGTAFRQWEISCIVSGGLGTGPQECKTLYQGLKLRFDRRLSTP